MRNLVLFTAFLAAGLNAGLAQAFTIAPYSAEAFAKAQAAGAPVALHFHAGWCPVCRAQEKTLNLLKTEPYLSTLTVLVADYDKETALKKEYKVRSQSTFIVFRGKVERARQTGSSAPDDLRSTLGAAM